MMQSSLYIRLVSEACISAGSSLRGRAVGKFAGQPPFDLGGAGPAFLVSSSPQLGFWLWVGGWEQRACPQIPAPGLLPTLLPYCGWV